MSRLQLFSFIAVFFFLPLIERYVYYGVLIDRYTDAVRVSAILFLRV